VPDRIEQYGEFREFKGCIEEAVSRLDENNKILFTKYSMLHSEIINMKIKIYGVAAGVGIVTATVTAVALKLLFP